jgi:hypothetical protein
VFFIFFPVNSHKLKSIGLRKGSGERVKKTVNILKHSMDTFKQEFETKQKFNNDRQQRYEEFLKKTADSKEMQEKFEQHEKENPQEPEQKVEVQKFETKEVENSKEPKETQQK